MAEAVPGERVWPEALRPGHRVVVVAPSGPSDPERVRRGVALITAWGLDVRLGRHALGAHDSLSYLSADDETRAQDFVSAWCEPSTRAVWAARGGYGSQRMADLVDYEVLRRAGPRHLIGYSDITALHARIGRELGQVTIHGPVVASLDQLRDAASVAQLQTLIMNPPAAGVELARGQTMVPGGATGRLVGGNLSLVATDVGVEPSPAEPSVVAFEDVGEDGYRIDRMLTQLLRSGWFAQVVGVVVGEFSEPDVSGLAAVVIADRLASLGIPLAAGLSVGHGPRNLALPLGAVVRLDCPSSSPAVLRLV